MRPFALSLSRVASLVGVLHRLRAASILLLLRRLIECDRSNPHIVAVRAAHVGLIPPHPNLLRPEVTVICFPIIRPGRTASNCSAASTLLVIVGLSKAAGRQIQPRIGQRGQDSPKFGRTSACGAPFLFGQLVCSFGARRDRGCGEQLLGNFLGAACHGRSPWCRRRHKACDGRPTWGRGLAASGGARPQ